MHPSLALVTLAFALASCFSPAAADVVAHYRFGEAAKVQAGDAAPPELPDAAGDHPLTGHGEPMLIGDVSPAAGDRVSSSLAVRFDGRDDAYTRRGVPTTATDNFAIEAWVRPARALEGGATIVHLGGGGGIGIAQNQGGVWGVLHGKATVGWAELAIGEWQHVALVVNGGKATLYLNGEPRGSFDGTPWGYGENEPFAIARHAEGEREYFQGDVDEARVFTFEPGTFDPSMLLVHGGAGAEARPTAPAGAAGTGDLVTSIVFDATPAERGMTFKRDAHNQATHVENGSGRSEAWRAQYDSAPGVGWGRSFYFNIEDERFRDGRQPAVDIEIVYRSTAWAPVELWADTAAGPRKVGSSWGNSGEWQTMRVRLDDARFARGSSGAEPMQMPSDGWDLRFNGYNDDLYIRSITIRGHDLTDDPDYARLLKLESIDHVDEIFLFTRGIEETLTYRLRNIAHKAVDTRYGFELSTWDGGLVDREEGTLRIEGGGLAALTYSFDTAGLPLGAYRLRFTLDRADGRGERIRDRESYLGVSFAGALPKAGEGEFLYGLDVMLGEPQHYDRLLRWIDAMGVDIVRGGGIRWDDLGHVERDLPIWEARGVRVLAMSDVPWHEDDAERRRQVAERADRLEQVARTLGDRVTWWELGNEPDLTFFYKGPIEAYADGFEEMARAIRRGDGGDLVANGGLCFAGDDATRRARRFIEVVDPEAVDAFAYHAHGPGATSERAMLERMRRVTAEFGKTGRPFIETESGVAARTPAQEITQARTSVQKMVYGQSEGLPLFIWFRLLMFEEDYGNLRTDQEPRPVVLAYRNMVRQLRGHEPTGTLDLGHGVETYGFRERSGDGRAVVLWSAGNAREVTLQIAGSGSAARDAKAIDLFGNESPLEVSPDGVVRLAADESPRFLRWRAEEAGFSPRPGPRLLEAPDRVALIRGSENPLTLRVRNPLQRPLDVTVRVEPKLDTEATASVTPDRLVLQPGEARDVVASVRVDASEPGLDWPEVWSVFLHVDPSVDVSALRRVPDELPGTRGTATRLRAWLAEDRLDFRKLGGEMREREAAVVMAEVESPRDQVVQVGASADWWMEWLVNGEPVYDTLATGNGGGYTITDHVFDLPLRKGRNLLAIRALSGSMGWHLLIGGPREVRVARSPAVAERVEVALDSGGETLARWAVAAELEDPVALLPASMGRDADAEAWEALEPNLLPDERGLRNFFEKQPDSTRWWQGPEDLSAYGWLRADDEALYVAVRVRDDRHAPEAGDALRLRLTSADGGGAELTRRLDASRKTAGDRVTRRADSTLYVARFERGELPGDLLSLKVVVEDGDGDTEGPKQELAWPASVDGHRLKLPPATAE